MNFARIRYHPFSDHLEAEYRAAEHTIDIGYSIDPITEIGTINFTKEAFDDIIAIAKKQGMNIELVSI